jgi:two-component system chemotaxis response regulator CheY
MTRPSVLSVGQCGFDHTRIAHYLKQTFRAEVLGLSSFDEALAALRRQRFDLILVNRVNDYDGAPGLDLIRRIKSEPGLSDLPVMLVSNYPEAQQEAEALGALPGFGKSDLASATTRARLEGALAAPSGSARGPGTERGVRS